MILDDSKITPRQNALLGYKDKGGTRDRAIASIKSLGFAEPATNAMLKDVDIVFPQDPEPPTPKHVEPVEPMAPQAPDLTLSHNEVEMDVPFTPAEPLSFNYAKDVMPIDEQVELAVSKVSEADLQDPQVLKELQRGAPPQPVAPQEPDPFLEDDDSEFDPTKGIDMETGEESFDLTDFDMPEDFNPMEGIDSLEVMDGFDPMASLDTDYVPLADIDPNAKWVPGTFEDYAKEHAIKEFDWMGPIDNSLTTHGVSYLFDKFQEWEDPNYVSPRSLLGKELAISSLTYEINQLGDIKVGELDRVAQADALWDKKHKLMLEIEIEKAMENSEFDFGQFKDALMDNPLSFLKTVAQEMYNKPELMIAPQFAAARAVTLTNTAAKALNAGKTATQVAKVVSGTIGAGVGGFTVGTVDRMITSASSTGELNMLKAMEQSDVDMIIGMATYGTGKVFSRGFSKYKASRLKDRTTIFQDKTMTTKSVEKLTDLEELQHTIDEGLEVYVDPNGNTYAVKLAEVVDFDAERAKLAEMENLRQAYKGDDQAYQALKAEIAATRKALVEARKQGASEGIIGALEQKLDANTNKRAEVLSQDEIVEAWNSKATDGTQISNKYMKFTDVNGNEHTMRRLTPTMLRAQKAKIEGMPVLSKGPNHDAQWYTKLKGYVVSATSPLKRMSEASPKAKELYDSLVKDSGKYGRSSLENLQSSTRSNIGIYLTKLEDITSKVKGKDMEQAVMKYLRGSGVEDAAPEVVEAATAIRGLIDESRAYIKSAGHKIPDDPNFLPRYYDEKILQNPDGFMSMVRTVNMKENPMGDPKKLEKIKRSVTAIRDRLGESDPQHGFVANGTKVLPFGKREWKNITDEQLDLFLDQNNFYAGLQRYFMNTVQRVERDKVFGINGQALESTLAQIRKELEGSKAGKLMTRAEEDAIKDVYNLVSGAYGGKSTFKPIADWALSLQNVFKLPFVTLTSVFEPLTMTFRLNEGGVTKALIASYIPGAKQLAGKMKGAHGFDLGDYRREVKEMGLVQTQALQESVARLTGEGLSGLPAKLNNITMKAYGLHMWTEHVRTVAYQAARNDLLKSIKIVAESPYGIKARTSRRHLAEFGIDHRQAVKWIEEGAPIDSKFYQKLKAGAATFTDTIAANANSLNKGKIMSTGRTPLRLLTQFKGFASVYNNDIFKPTIDEATKLWNEGRKVKAMQKMSAMLAATSTMAYWVTYKTPLLFGEGLVSDDEPGEITQKLMANMLGMMLPGGSVFGDVMSGRGITGALGPTVSDAITLSEGGDVRKIAPTYKKIDDELLK